MSWTAFASCSLHLHYGSTTMVKCKTLQFVFVRYDFDDIGEQNTESSLLQLLGKTTYLDPRYRTKYLSPALCEAVKKQIIEEGNQLQLLQTDHEIGKETKTS